MDQKMTPDEPAYLQDAPLPDEFPIPTRAQQQQQQNRPQQPQAMRRPSPVPQVMPAERQGHALQRQPHQQMGQNQAMQRSQPQPGRPALQMNEQGQYVVRNESEEMAVYERMKSSGILPKTIATLQQFSVALQALRSMNLNPFASISQCGFINGTFTLFKDLPLAVARATGEMEYFEEFPYVVDPETGEHKKIGFSHGNTHMEPTGYACILRRRGGPDCESFFTVDMAKKAGLWGKPGPWSQYPQTMLMRKARDRVLRSVFADALNCHSSVEDSEIVEQGSTFAA